MTNYILYGFKFRMTSNVCQNILSTINQIEMWARKECPEFGNAVLYDLDLPTEKKEFLEKHKFFTQLIKKLSKKSRLERAQWLKKGHKILISREWLKYSNSLPQFY